MPQEPEFHPVVTPEPDDDISDEDFAIVDSSLPSAEQLNRSRRSERSRSRVRVPPRSSSHTSQQPQPVVPPSGVQQTQATQGEDHDAAIVHPQAFYDRLAQGQAVSAHCVISFMCVVTKKEVR